MFTRIFYLGFIFTWLTSYPGNAQILSIKKAKERTAAIFETHTGKPQVLLLGVFHFAGEQVDSNTTPTGLKTNMLSAERQRQVTELVNKLIRFNPTKIVIEAPPRAQVYIDSLYHDYCAGKQLTGKYLSPADEHIQLGFRLAKMLHLQKLYPVDVQPFRFNLNPADSFITYEKYKDQADSSYDYWDSRYEQRSALMDSLKFYLSLKDYLHYLNLPQTQAQSIGRWLVTTKRGTDQEPIGADGFITRYFNRNVRIYANIQRIVTSKQDRILVIYGATHMFFLKQLFIASPEFNLTDIEQYLK